jgi:hypothetical protein
MRALPSGTPLEVLGRQHALRQRREDDGADAEFFQRVDEDRLPRPSG